ncbi:Lactonase, 7-bladed beta-propeller-domain-containing protein [Pelagophyceae sp. CCMP2097]|nr:Lactonase, 7-bladed beta-propeller-domain-containing protein [Pelagophyceae sp. CCMP2097]
MSGMAVPRRVLVGTYSQDLGFVQGKGDGIYLLEVDLEGVLKLDAAKPCLGADVFANPTYLASAGSTVLAVDERTDLAGGGRVAALSFDGASQTLRVVGAPVASGDSSSCHVIAGAKHAIVANYCGGEAGAGSVAAFASGDSGGLGDAVKVALPPPGTAVTFPGAVADRQGKSHAHMVLLSRSGRTVLVMDLGADVVWRVPYDSTNAAAPLGTAAVACTAEPGAGPRHAVLHPTKDVLYVLNELACTMSAFVTDSDGVPAATAPFATVSTVDAGTVASGAAVRVHPAGGFVYCSNRVVGGEGTVACFAVDETGAPLTASRVLTLTGGRVPRDINFVLEARLLLAANQDSDSIVAFRVDAQTGALTNVASVFCPTPVCFCELDA